MKLGREFYERDALTVAAELAGKVLVRRFPDGSEQRTRITETEAYRGEEDKACHASKGRTRRTETLYREAGTIYVYLCYGVHWLMNIVTGEVEQPQAVLLRAGEGCKGPALLAKTAAVDKSFNGQSIYSNSEVWIEDDGRKFELRTAPRVGINYADEEWRNKQWRFIIIKN